MICVLSQLNFRDEANSTYQCAHTILKCHARAYRMYYEEFFAAQQGRVGITIDSGWYAPLDPDNAEDIIAAERAVKFQVGVSLCMDLIISVIIHKIPKLQHGWFGWPVFFGKYPDEMREYVDRKSAEENLTKSRLPEFDRYWETQVKGQHQPQICIPIDLVVASYLCYFRKLGLFRTEPLHNRVMHPTNWNLSRMESRSGRGSFSRSFLASGSKFLVEICALGIWKAPSMD